MTQAENTAGPAVNASRQRPPRLELKRAERRRRKAGTLNRMAQFKLDIFDESQLDSRYVHRWVEDEGSRLRQATKGDDYDFVNTADLGGFDADTTDSESSERVRMVTGVDKQGHPTYAYLLRKPREYFEEDMAENCQFREDVMEQRVFQGEDDGFNPETGLYDDVEPDAERDSAFYAAKGNTLGGPNGSGGGRRRGALARKPS